MATENSDSKNEFKCHFCTICNGTGCIGQIPGMGGVNRNENFRLNCNGWEVCRKENPLSFVNFLERPVAERIPKISLAPVTGAVENIGFADEQKYYREIFHAAFKAGVGICIGDGFPDYKLKYGIKAIESLRKTENSSVKASIFIKPFVNEKILEHIALAGDYAENLGIDIDSYNISTMKNLVQMEKKTAGQLIEIKNSVKVPFILKGIFTVEDIELVKKVKPDIAYISNHGGRVETRIGSTAEFLLNYAKTLKNYCGQVWVDGGIRSALDVATAMTFGADRILVGRPFVSSFCKNGEKGFFEKTLELTLG